VLAKLSRWHDTPFFAPDSLRHLWFKPSRQEAGVVLRDDG
jgi:hypothetical protein